MRKRNFIFGRSSNVMLTAISAAGKGEGEKSDDGNPTFGDHAVDTMKVALGSAAGGALVAVGQNLLSDGAGASLGGSSIGGGFLG